MAKNNNSINNFIKDALCNPLPTISYHISQTLHNLFPNKAIITSIDTSFSFYDYALSGHCTLTSSNLVHSQLNIYWNESDIGYVPANAWFDITWKNQDLSILQMSWKEDAYSCNTTYYCIIADTEKLAEEFFSAVCQWSMKIQDEILVFEDDTWNKDKKLFQSIKSSTFDNLILPEFLKQQLQEDFKQFFTSQETYEKYGVPWKRGAIFIGPPGNGKTHAVKAIINSSEQPCLYVKSFKSHYNTEQHNIRSVFERTRETIPCILVLEDLDSLINDENRAYFLNELDGFASNTGLVTIATTNHPKRLDPAILERPSRFDRKYYFDLPNQQERLNYILFWNSRLKENLHLSDTAINNLINSTKNFSFAYLKELLLSSIMEWMSQKQSVGIEEILDKQTKLLRKQINDSANKKVRKTDT